MYKILLNKSLICVLVSWAVAQLLKFLIASLKEKQGDIRKLISTGGMPSSHSAGVSALATSVGILNGFDSIAFAITSVFGLIVMFDAQSVRRAAGEQAEILNKIINDFYNKKNISKIPIRELLGHTPVEVLVGGILGIVISCVLLSIL
jgi:acid phosphatase family membrane protein YuiD